MNFLLLSLVLILAACSSTPIKEKYSCVSSSPNEAKNPEKYGQKYIRLRYCSETAKENDEKFGIQYEKGKKYMGLADDHDATDWYLDPVYKDISIYNEELFLVRKHGEKFYSRFDYNTKTSTPTEIAGTKYIMAYENQNPQYHASTAMFIAGEKEDKLSFQNYQTAEVFKTIENIDEEISDFKHRKVAPVYAGVEGGVLVRHNEQGNKYYKLYGYDGKELTSEKIPVSDISFVLLGQKIRGEDRRVYTAMRKLSNGLYWPILFSAREYLEKPDSIEGIYLSTYEKYSHQFPYLDDWYIKWQGKNRISRVHIDSYYKTNFLGRKKTILDFNKVPDYGKIYENVKSARFVLSNESDGKKTVKPIFKTTSGKYKLGKGDETYRSEAKAMTAMYTKTNSAMQEDYAKKMAKYHKDKARYDAAKGREQGFINMIHKYGLGASGGSASYDAEQYCNYKGPRCASYRKQARSMQAAGNAKAAAANRKRLNDLSNSGGPSEATRIKNAKCRDAANRQNRHAGSIKYGCK